MNAGSAKFVILAHFSTPTIHPHTNACFSSIISAKSVGKTQKKSQKDNMPTSSTQIVDHFSDTGNNLKLVKIGTSSL